MRSRCQKLHRMAFPDTSCKNAVQTAQESELQKQVKDTLELRHCTPAKILLSTKVKARGLSECRLR
jgi:hypothetical protein